MDCLQDFDRRSTISATLFPVAVSEPASQFVTVRASVAIQYFCDTQGHRRVVCVWPRRGRYDAITSKRRSPFLVDQKGRPVKIPKESFAKRVTNRKAIERQPDSFHSNFVVTWQ